MYDALAASGELGSGSLADACALDERSVAEALRELSVAGLVDRQGPDGQVTVRIGGPAALHGLLTKPDSSIARSLLEARQALDDVLGLQAAGTPGIERVTGPDVILERLRAVLSTARREVLNLQAGKVPSQAELDDAASHDFDLVRRGLVVRTVCPQYFADQEHFRAYVHLMDAEGAQTRFTDGVPHRLLVIDRRTAIVPVRPDEPRAGAVFVREPAVVGSLFQLAVTILRSGRPLAEVVASDKPSDLERRVLMLMSAGLTDTVSAKKLSVTDRQFRRYVARVMEKLGAQSRFQAGVKAVERGWL